MKIVDLTHIMSRGMPVYPGTEPPQFKVGCTIEEDGFREKEIIMYSHTGTHVDAPAHLVRGYKTLDQLETDHFYGDAIILDFGQTPGKSIGIDDLKPFSERLSQVDFVIIKTGWSHFWGTEEYFSGYCVLTSEAAEWLSRCSLKGLGLDTISADPADTKDFEIHKILFGSNMIIIENLTNLEEIGSDIIRFSCFPLRIKDADGSPVRAVAYVDSNEEVKP